jgi:glycosyltransferase involved in cell wall biosynthesis
MDALISDSRVVILIPVYRDWECVSTVCQLLDQELARLPEVKARIILVDDGSPDGLAGWRDVQCSSLVRIDVLRLRTNLGHQRAICAGLCYVHDKILCDWILVMDGDGEDPPVDAVRLIDTALSQRIAVLFSERRKRLEGPVFRTGYIVFRILHRILTGVSVRVGNFSIISSSVVDALVCMPELWNHYAGALFKSKIDFTCLPMDRGKRLQGKSKMNFISLVTHGLAGIATFYEAVATRILIFNVIGLIVLLTVLAAVFTIKFWSDLAIPGWATYTTGFIVIVFTQLAALSFNLVFSLISSRSRMPFLPVRDYHIYVATIENLADGIEAANRGGGD